MLIKSRFPPWMVWVRVKTLGKGQSNSSTVIHNHVDFSIALCFSGGKNSLFSGVKAGRAVIGPDMYVPV